MNKIEYKNNVEKWDAFEAKVNGKSEGNPFMDYSISATFQSKNEIKTVDGFYDGNGIYRVRFMPSFVENYSFIIKGSFSDEVLYGAFTVTQPSRNNHGPVRVSNTYHFAYEDGTPYFCLGTTCYVWHLQNEKLQQITLDTLSKSAFNKIRFCIFPKHYDYNLYEPISYPYVGTPMDSSCLNSDNFLQYNGKAIGNDFDYNRFNVSYFQHLEDCIKELMKLGIEADLIIFHPYDRWGFSEMGTDCDLLYIKYLIARVSAYRNVWWSLANEYDLLSNKSLKDWELYANTICEKDAYNHLRSIHNCHGFYNYNKPWITHCSIQRQDLYKTAELVNQWRIQYKKPIVLDEIAYEGNIQYGWGNISGKEMTRRFWEAFVRGGYPGHGETYLNTNNILWWSHGGDLHGSSPQRIAFLKQIMIQTPTPGLKPWERAHWDEVVGTLDDKTKPNEYFIFYYSFMCPSFRDFYFDDESSYQVEVIDTWNMTIKNKGIFKGKFRIELPAHEYMAIRIQRNH